jgi:hypothetical protein
MSPMNAVFFAVLSLCLGSCSHTSTRVINGLHPSSLPKDEGVYTGSIRWHRWTYAGTDADGHHVRYRYHRANSLSYRDFVFQRKCFGFQFDLSPPRTDLRDLFAITPIMQTDLITGFRRDSESLPQDRAAFERLRLPPGLTSLHQIYR